MRIGVMLRDIWNQADAPGIIVLNMMDRILALDDKNEYVLFFRDGRFIDRYNGFPNAKAVVLRSPNKFFWDQLAVPLAARRESVDLVFHPKHSVPLLCGKKTVMQLRGAEYWIYPDHFELLDVFVQRLLIPLYCWKATRIITESQDVDRDFKRFLNLPDSKTSMIYLAYNERFCPINDAGDLEKCKDRYGLPNRFIFTVTRVLQNRKYYPGKNLVNAIEAFRRSRVRTEVKFVIVGRETRAFVRKMYPHDDDIHKDLVVLDYVQQEELPHIYNLADTFLFPSKYESFGIPILEAMACGCPVITSTSFSCPEIAGEAARLVRWDDVDDISSAIDDVVANAGLRADLRRKSLDRAKMFSWEDTARRTIKLFAECE